MAPESSTIDIVAATSDAGIAAARELFQEYGQSLGFDLCFQSFEQELAELPGKYSSPRGRLLLAQQGGRYVGCVALRPLQNNICEMKRLYVCPEARGMKLGRALAERIIAEGRALGYAAMRLDTVPGVMDSAIALYRTLGFKEIAAYCNNPVAGAIFLELKL